MKPLNLQTCSSRISIKADLFIFFDCTFRMDKVNTDLFKNLRNDLPAALIVFLIAIPLCLGIALASGTPLFSGIIAGVIGGVVVGFLSGSPLGVSGPAAGLVAIVLGGIITLGSFQAFLLALVVSGVIQILLGFAKAGIIGYYFPNAVIKGMLSGIGLIIILKQIPHALGFNEENEGTFSFWQRDGENTFTELSHIFEFFSLGPSIVAFLSLMILILWEQKFMKKVQIFQIIQGPLVVVIFGILYTVITGSEGKLSISTGHLVSLPIISSFEDFKNLFTYPDFSQWTNPAVYTVAFTLAVVGSIETLLSVEATDKLDPYKRVTPTNRELKAQGVGNIISGLVGGLPITQVIVRSSANIQSGGRTKMSAIIHGLFLLLCALSIPALLNKIPLAALAAILLSVGYKLTKPEYYRDMWKKGRSQFVPFVATIAGILLTDLLVGIGIGLAISVVFILYANFRSSYFFDEERYKKEDIITIKLSQEVSFLNKASLLKALNAIPNESRVIIDAADSTYIDEDVKDIIKDFSTNASFRGIQLSILQSKDGGLLPVATNLFASIADKEIGKYSVNNQIVEI